MDENVAVVFPEPQRAVLERGPVPEPGAGELLIRTRRTLISTGTELTIYGGAFPRDSAWSRYGRFPFKPGYSSVGDVVAVGAGVDPAWVGKRVGSSGKHARYALQPAPTLEKEVVFELPEAIGDDEATFLHLAAHTVLNGVRRGGVQFGEAAVVYGLGILGQFAARFCALSGARPVIGVDVAPSRLALLPRTPAFVALDAREGHVARRVEELNHGRKADIVFEVTGNPDLIPSEFELVKRQGRFVMLSSPRGPTNFDFHDLCNAPSITIVGAHGGSIPAFETPYNPWTKRRNGELVLDLAIRGELDLQTLISHREPYARAPELYVQLYEDRSAAMGVVLDWS
ncbi:MAG: zinc-binding dehydrogenase [Planctomycetota bacterium]|nr:zinc-binding dehydrogenase [Planctomycetota bacterium]